MTTYELWLSQMVSSKKSESAPGTLTIRNWPLVDEFPVSWLMVLGQILVGGLIGRMAENWWLGFFAAGALIFSTWRIWVPVGFTVRPDGLVERALGRQTHYRWHEFASVRRSADGVMLVPGRADGRLANLHGVYIRCGADTDRFSEQIGRYVQEASFMTEPTDSGHLRPGSSAPPSASQRT